MATANGREDDLVRSYEDCINHLDQLERAWQSKNEYENRFGQLAAAISKMQQQQAIGVQQHELAAYTQHYQKYQEKIVQIKQIIPAWEQKVIKQIEAYILSCENLCVSAGNSLEKWKWQQKTQQYGGLIQGDYMSEVTKKFQTAMEHAFSAWKLLSRFHAFRAQGHSSSAHLDASVQNLCQRANVIFVQILHNSFVITTQPPMVVKNKIRLEATLLAAIDKLGFEAQTVTMQSRIISEETATELKANPAMLEQKIQTVGQIDGAYSKAKQLQRLSQNTLGFELKNIKVTVESRKQATKSGEAIMKKYYFLCSTEIIFNNQTLKLHAFSLPFMVSVHGTQDVELYARAFWDMAFSKSVDSIPMQGEPEVRWHNMGPALEAIFAILTKGSRRLSAHDIEYLKYRLFNGNVPQPDPVVTWQLFYKEKLDRLSSDTTMESRRKCMFSFWEWLFKLGDMIQEKSGRDTGVSEMWEEKYIEGFISKNEADAKLKQAHEPMMLIRFSDNQLAGLSLVYRDPYTREINHLIPFKFKEETEKLTLPFMVVNCKEVQDIQKIYPDKARERIEEKVAASKRSSVEEQDFTSYKSRVLVMETSNGERPLARTPSYPMTPSPTHFPTDRKPSNPNQSANQLFPPQPQPRASAHVKMEVSRSPNPAFGSGQHAAYGMNDVQIVGEFSQHAWDGHFDNFDEHRVQSIMQDLLEPDDDYEMDSFVQIVQSFDNSGAGAGATTNGMPQIQAPMQTQQGIQGFGGQGLATNMSHGNYEFEML